MLLAHSRGDERGNRSGRSERAVSMSRVREISESSRRSAILNYSHAYARNRVRVAWYNGEYRNANRASRAVRASRSVPSKEFRLVTGFQPRGEPRRGVNYEHASLWNVVRESSRRDLSRAFPQIKESPSGVNGRDQERGDVSRVQINFLLPPLKSSRNSLRKGTREEDLDRSRSKRSLPTTLSRPEGNGPRWTHSAVLGVREIVDARCSRARN